MGDFKELPKVVTIGTRGSGRKATYIKRDSRGLIIAAYPGMFQDVYCNFYNTVKHLPFGYDEKYTLNVTKEVAIEDYVKLAIKVSESGTCGICFIDTDIDVVKHMITHDIPFIIMVPNTKGTDNQAILRRLHDIYTHDPSSYNGKILTDVIENGTSNIDNLCVYNNVVTAGKEGIISNAFINTILEMDYAGRLGILKSVIELKRLAAEGKPLTIDK